MADHSTEAMLSLRNFAVAYRSLARRSSGKYGHPASEADGKHENNDREPVIELRSTKRFHPAPTHPTRQRPVLRSRQ